VKPRRQSKSGSRARKRKSGKVVSLADRRQERADENARADRLMRIMDEFMQADRLGDEAGKKLAGRGLSTYSNDEINAAHRAWQRENVL